jgi:DNA transposition AAA+ family ATPase
MVLAALAPLEDGSEPRGRDEHRLAAEHAAIYVDRVREDLAAYLSRTHKPQSVIARGIGMSDSVISQFLSGKYPAKDYGIARAIDAFLVIQAQRDLAPREPRFVETANAAKVRDRMEIVHELGSLGIFYGAAGSGKTRSAREYQRAKGDTVIFVTAKPVLRSPHAFLMELAEQIKTPTGYTVNRLQGEIETKLKDSGRLLIVDEAERLTFRTIETIQSIRDETGIGVAFLADEVLWKLINDRRRSAEYERFISRAPVRLAMSPILPREDVARIAVQYLAHTDEECITYLCAKAAGVGGFRAVVYYAWMACRLAQAEKRSVSVRDLQRVAAQFGDQETVVRLERGR